MTSSFLARLARARRDDGFGLVEAIVALSIAAVVFTALAYAAIGAIRASMVSRQAQQATDVATARLEQLRELSYAGLGHVAADLAGDSAVATCGANKCFNPGTGAEQLVVLASGGFAPHITTASGTQTNNTVFTLKSYVTKPANTGGADYRRVTVVVSWSTAGVTSTKQISTLVTYTQRGLPLPVFKLTSFTASPYAINPSATAPFLLRLTNQGAPDRWDITRSGTAGWLFFLDDGDGVWNAALDTTALADTDGNGTIDTGLIAPAGELSFWAVLPTTAATPVGTYPTTITATSAAQPLAAGGTATVPLSVSVQTGPVSNPTPTPTATPTSTETPTPSPTPSATPTAAATCPAAAPAPSGTAVSGYTLKRYVLHNRSGNNTAWPPNTGTVPATTTTGQGIPLTAAVDSVEFPTATDPLVYSDNISPAGTAGRILGTSSGSQASGTNPATMVDWRGSTTNKKNYSGTAVLQYWVAAVPGSPLTAVNLQSQLYTVKNGTITPIGSVAAYSGAFSCAGWQEVWVTIPVTASTGGNLQLGVRLWNNGTTPVRIAYDTGTFPSSLVLPEK